MFEQFTKFDVGMKPDDLKAALKEKRELLISMQQKIKEAKLPVFVILDGWGAAGKGTLISKLTKDLDPRFFNVVPMKDATSEEKRKPFLWRFMEIIPEAGKFVFIDSSWMREVVDERVTNNISHKQYEEKLGYINIFERQLRDNGYLVVKMFLHISEKEQHARIHKLLQKKSTFWRIGPKDIYQLEHYKKYEQAYDEYMNATNTLQIPWHLIDGADEKEAFYQAISILTDQISKYLQHPVKEVPILKKNFPMVKMPAIADVPLNQEMTKEEYDKKLKKLHKKLRKLHDKIYKKKIPVIIAYEGWDAAGKGGNIKRLTNSLDARGFEVFPIASPEPHEKSRHYLWRFWTRLPKNGHIAIFDRTWYGRVMVERLEGFCSENDWQRAYNEINEFEKGLHDWGAVVIKFWIQIDKDTQLARFTERQNTPSKQWKITDEDWRNRDKWDQYEDAVNEMIQKTSTKYAPWHIIPSNNKYFARIKALETTIDALEKRLKKIEKQ